MVQAEFVQNFPTYYFNLLKTSFYAHVQQHTYAQARHSSVCAQSEDIFETDSLHLWGSGEETQVHQVCVTNTSFFRTILSAPTLTFKQVL